MKLRRVAQLGRALRSGAEGAERPVDVRLARTGAKRRPWVQIRRKKLITYLYYGAWLSLVERCVRDAEVVGSNPVAPRIKKDTFVGYPFYLCLLPTGAKRRPWVQIPAIIYK